jgi:SNF family Na+-dependent transporter
MPADDSPSKEEPLVQRPEYANKCELMLSLVGYAVGLGNIWRFPYLAYQYGGGAFLIPYTVSLLFLGLPLFILELGLGQIFRTGTLGVWEKLGLSRLQGVGVAATMCTWFVSLYYNIILTWTVYYIGRTIMSIPSGVLPWTDQVGGDFTCPSATFFIHTSESNNIDDLFSNETGLYDQTIATDTTFWCRNQEVNTTAPDEYFQYTLVPKQCPSAAAIQFWQKEVLRQSSGMDDLRGIEPGKWLAYTVTWLMVYFIVFKGVGSSGKVVYVTALLPYVVLIIFFIRAITLPGAGMGAKFFVTPEYSGLLEGEVWQRAMIQIFYSLGVGFGSLIAFASYGKRDDNFVGNAVQVSTINAGTSVFAGFVVFPILGYLAAEISEVNPCVRPEQIGDLSIIGLTGPSLAFIAFPIAISRMPLAYVWAFLFFALLLCLGIDSEFAMIESVMTVLKDSGVAGNMSHPKLAAIVCGVSYFIGLIFITDAGIYWFNLFDYYSCVVVMFFVCGLECFGLMFAGGGSAYHRFKSEVLVHTGITLPAWLAFLWKWVCPTALVLIMIITLFDNPDLMGANESVPFPEGEGYLPAWSVKLGWMLGASPLVACFAILLCSDGVIKSTADAITRTASGIKRRLTDQTGAKSDESEDSSSSGSS